MLALADVAVVVSNANASAEWWTKHFGFATTSIGRSGHAVMVAPPGDRFVLHLCQGFAPLEPGDTGIAFVTDELEALSTRLVESGVKFPVPLDRAGGGRTAKFADPDGNIFWLIGVPTAMARATLRSHAPARGRSGSSPKLSRGRRGPSKR